MTEHVAREEILIGRVVDNEATPAEWNELEALAAHDGAVWARLARTQRDADALRAGFELVAAGAEEADSADRVAGAAHAMSIRLRSWTGWAAAAAIALAWVGLRGVLQTGGQTRPGAEVAGILTPDEALQRYLSEGEKEGRVVGQLPKQMLDVRTNAKGEREVVYIRAICEVAPFDRMYHFVQDEHGRPVIAPVPASQMTPGVAF